MKKIGIIGYGYVGKAFYEFFKNHYEIYVYDNNEEKIHEAQQEKINIRHINNLNTDSQNLHLIVICVNTPSKEDGSTNIENVDNVLATIQGEKLVLIKSTIPPKSTNNFSKKYPHLRLVFSPEYIGESIYYLPYPYNFHKEVIKVPYFIFGGKDKDTSEAIEYYILVAGPTKEYIQTDSLSAEICKYMENTYFATKIIFCNEFYNLCKHFNTEYTKVRELWLKDNRINKLHTLIYNQDKPFCFGGNVCQRTYLAL